MAKKLVRGITGIKNIEKQDFDTNNVNDLLSDGEHTYVHRKKKDKTEEYHCLTNNIKSIQTDNSDLLTVTNYNNTKNSAVLHPKHDEQKEQVLQSSRNTITINHGENGTANNTSVDTNPAKVLEHDNLKAGNGITKSKSGNTVTLSLNQSTVETIVDEKIDSLEIDEKIDEKINSLDIDEKINNLKIDEKIKNINDSVDTKITTLNNNINDSVDTKINNLKIDEKITNINNSVDTKINNLNIDSKLANKQNKLVSNNSIVVNDDNTLGVKIYTSDYDREEGFLRTYTKTVKHGSEFRYELTFNYCIKAGHEFCEFALNEHDLPLFQTILHRYGVLSFGSYDAHFNNTLILLVENVSKPYLRIGRHGEDTSRNLVISFTDII